MPTSGEGRWRHPSLTTRGRSSSTGCIARSYRRLGLQAWKFDSISPARSRTFALADVIPSERRPEAHRPPVPARPARSYVAAFGCTLLSTATALAQPPAHGHRPPLAPLPPPATPVATVRPASPAASAYMAGKQALVGLHAPSSEPAPCDTTGRPMLSLRSVNRGESLAIVAASDDGGFAAVDLDRVARLLRAMSGDEHPIDPRTLALAYRIQRHFGVPEVRVVSGYRVPRPGSRSNHARGRAMDLIVPGTADSDVA